MNPLAVMNLPIRARWIRRLLLSLTAAAVPYAVLLTRPQIVFAYEVRADNVVLHARSPLPGKAAEIAAAAQRRVSRSPFYVPTDTYDVYLCDTPALFAFFALWHHNVGGFADVYFSRNVWLRPSHVERDRLVGPSGAEASGDRTLTYFVAHEITHTMTARRLGRRGYYRLEKWQQEGYADYVGKGGAFDFPATQRAFQAGVPALDPRRSGLYLRYHLLVAELIDNRGMTPEALLSHAIDAAPIEKELAARDPENRATGSTRRLQEGAATGIPGTFTTEAVPSEQRTVRVGSIIANPQKIVDAPPVYPEQARRTGVKGVVLLELTIGTDGRVIKSQVIRSIPMLDAAAVEAAKQWRYEPTLLNGGPVPIILIAAVKFP